MLQYIVFDEAHLLKNMKTNRNVQLMKIKSHRRLLRTGTPRAGQRENKMMTPRTVQKVLNLLDPDEEAADDPLDDLDGS